MFHRAAPCFIQVLTFLSAPFQHVCTCACACMRARARATCSDVIRMLVSTDNHLGFAELDPIRGGDSFAAFEEVLATAREHNVDLLLLSGDLFHDNKPSRHTMYRYAPARRSVRWMGACRVP